jgi:hypothetical protein
VAVGSENGHGSEVVLLLGSQPIEPNAEEVAVERVDDARSGRPDVVAGNRTRGRRIPDVVAPFLEEVRVAAGLRHDTVDRRGSQLDPEFVGRNDNGRRSFLRRQRAQDGELEEALGIGPGRADQSRQLRQAGAGQDDRQTELCRPVNGRHQGGELVGGQVLDFVDDHHQRGFASGRGLAGRHEYIGQVFRQQARIRPAGERVDADGDRRSHRQLERERLEHAQRGGDRSANQAVPLEQNPRSRTASSVRKSPFSDASMNPTFTPSAPAISARWFNRTVLPTPRSPTSMQLLADLPLSVRRRVTPNSSIRSSRPIKAGGRMPAPGW